MNARAIHEGERAQVQHDHMGVELSLSQRLPELRRCQEIQFTGSLAIQSFRYPALLSMIERGRLAPRKLVTETIPLEKAFGVLDQMSKFENVGISVIDQF